MKKKLEKPVLADGELTGHRHVLADEKIDVFENENQTREFDLPKHTDIQHQEHKTVVLPAGEYLADKVREYDPAAEEAKRVQD